MLEKRRYNHWLLAAVLCLPAVVAYGSEDRYRVSGIVMTPEKQLAVVEKSDGTQQLYKHGEEIDGFVVEHIDADGIFLKRGDESIFLELEGTPTRLEDVAAALKASDLQIASGHATQSVDYDVAQIELDELTRTQGSTESNAEQRGATLEERLNMALGLPSHTSITAINRDAVQRPEQAVMLLASKVARGETVRLEVGGSIPGVDVLYLTPSPPTPNGRASR